jgi:hypothetical protein
LAKLTVPQLKAFLQSVSVVPKGKKADLVELVQQHFEE